MAGQRKKTSRTRLMENITLLKTLNEIIELPRENTAHEDDDSSRQLSIDREKTIADLLSFLSATHDDNSKIMAVCIEESPGHKHLTIRIASNTGDCAYVRDGLNEMARILERAHSRGTLKFNQYSL